MSNLDLGGMALLPSQRASEEITRQGVPPNPNPKQGTPVSSHLVNAGGSPQAEVLMKILIIEDEANIAQVIRLYLEQANYTVLTASDGAAGLELHAREQPDLVILDLMLPVMDGMEGCRRIRAWADTPILMLTARQGEEERIAGLELGADDYLVKPFSPREVVSRVKAILRRTSRAGALPSREAEPQAEVVGAHPAFQVAIPKANHSIDSGASDKAKARNSAEELRYGGLYVNI